MEAAVCNTSLADATPGSPEKAAGLFRAGDL